MPARRSRRSAETQLSRLPDRSCRDLVMTVADYIWSIDEHGTIRDVDLRAPDADDLSRADMLGRPLASLAPPGERTAMTRAVARRLARREAFRELEINVRRKDGGVRNLEVGGTPLFASDRRFLGYLGVGRDVTVKRRAVAAADHDETMRSALVDAATSLDSNCTVFWPRSCDRSGTPTPGRCAPIGRSAGRRTSLTAINQAQEEE